jgi:CHAD domain-containing protein
MNELSRTLKRRIRDVDRGITLVSKRQALSDVHRLRVSARRLKAIFWVLKKGTSVEISRPLERTLSRLTHLLGQRRELDVLARDARHYHLEVQAIQKMSIDASVGLVDFLNSKKTQNLLNGAQNILGELEEKDSVHLRRVRRALKEKFRRWSNGFPRNPGELHRLRIALKKAKYVLEAIDRPTGVFEKVQRDLGRYRDLQVLLDYTGKHRRVTADAAVYLRRARRHLRPALVKIT